MDEKVRELLELVFRKCVLITTRTKADVFFSYDAHINCYTISYYLKGYQEQPNNSIYTDVVSKINMENLQRTSEELDKLWELTEEKNLRKN